MRTIDEVESVLSNAKVLEKDLKPVTQVLSFSEPSELDENLVLLELDSGLLNILTEGERYVSFCLLCLLMSLINCGRKDDLLPCHDKNLLFQLGI